MGNCGIRGLIANRGNINIMFRGEYHQNLDNKGRVNIPSKFREVLTTNFSEKLILTKFDGCIAAYPIEEWTILEEKARSLSSMKKEVRDFLRFFYSGAVECSIDKHGRTLIPPVLRSYAGLNKEVVFIGIISKIEIWSKEKWDEINSGFKDRFEELADKLGEIGF